MPPIVDLRSDTVTRPCTAMRRAMAEAEVGDDVFGDDPTVNLLQARVAQLFGKPAALFTPSGSMANQLAIRSVCEPGDELILEESTHSYKYEGGAACALSGVSVRLVEAPRGIFTPQAVHEAVRPPDHHYARSRMVIIENTNNRGGGSVWPVEQVAAIRKACDEHGLHLHIDGARLMNACVAAGVPAREYTRHAHSVSMCFSKGLGAPIGSILAGETSFIERAHRFRKMFGGGMRQAGILAAAALYALDQNIERLAEDHRHARALAEALAGMPGVRLDPASVQTNIVIFTIDPSLGPASAVVGRLKERGVLVLATGPQSIRAVTHLDVAPEMIERAIAAFRASLSS